MRWTTGLLCSLLLFSSPVWAAITFDTAQTWQADAGSGAGGDITVGSGTNRVLYICRSLRDNTSGVAIDASPPTVNGNASTHLAGINQASNVMRADLYYYLNPPSGTVTVATTPHANTDRNLTSAVAYAGVAQTSTFGTPVTNQGQSTNMDTDSIGSSLLDVVVQCGAPRSQDPRTNAAADPTVPVSTERVDDAHSATTSTLTITFYEEAGAGTSTNVRVDLDTSVQWAAVGVAMHPAADEAPSERNRGVVELP